MDRPAELVFGRDMIFDRSYKANWEEIRRHKQTIINKNKERENAKRVKYTYRAGDLVLYSKRSGSKHSRHYDGPFEILEVYSNGTVKIARGDRRVKDRINIRLLTPYEPRR